MWQFCAFFILIWTLFSDYSYEMTDLQKYMSFMKINNITLVLSCHIIQAVFLFCMTVIFVIRR